MKRQRLLKVCLSLALVLVLASCGGNNILNDDEAAVFIMLVESEYDPYISMCYNEDAQAELVLANYAKDPTVAGWGGQQRVTLTRWEVTPSRTDGGTPSPPWAFDMTVTIGSGSLTEPFSATIFPTGNYNDPPLAYLFPENGGIDPETGNSIVAQNMQIKVFGRTRSGKSVSVEFSLDYLFACSWGYEDPSL